MVATCRLLIKWFEHENQVRLNLQNGFVKQDLTQMSQDIIFWNDFYPE